MATQIVQRMVKARATLVVLIALVGIIRLLAFSFILSLDSFASTDYWSSLPQSVAAGQGYQGCNAAYFITCTEPIPSAAREPVTVYFYAALMKVFGTEVAPIFVAQVLLDMLTGLLIYQIAMRVFRSRGIALTSLALWAVYLPAISLTGQLNWGAISAALTALFVLALVWVLEQPTARRFLLTGAVLGLLCLSRSGNLALLPLLVPLFWIALRGSWRLRLGYTAVFAASAILVLSPWVIRNYQVFNAFVPGTTLNGYNLFRHNWVIEDIGPLWYGDGLETAAQLRDRLAGKLRGDENEVELDRLYVQEALTVIRRYPQRYIQLSLSRLADGWFNLRPAQHYRQEAVTFTFTLVVNGLLWLLAVPALLIAPFGWFRRGWPLALLLAFSTLVYLPVTVRMAYLVPAAPYLFMLAAYGAGVIWKSWRSHLAAG